VEKEGSNAKKEGKEFSGGHGLQKPADLPEKPHNIPHSDPVTGKTTTKESSDGSSRDEWLQDTMPYTDGRTNPAPPKKSYWSSTPAPPTTDSDAESWHEWFHSFVLSFTMIIFSEIGDKTFLVAALMAMRHPRILVFSAAFGALIVMTVLSAILGHAFPSILPKRLTTFAAAVLFLVFGAKSLKDGLAMSPDEGVGEEMKEVEAELEEKELSMSRDISKRRESLSPYALESGRGRQPNIKPSEPSPPSSRSPTPPSRNRSVSDRLSGLTNLLSLILSPAWVQTFIMTFLGEWGDRSQIATIAMAAGQDYWWVTLGAISGHAICTGLAVLGGRALAGRVSLRVGKSKPHKADSMAGFWVFANVGNSHHRRRRRISCFRGYLFV
jgi:putative Ca2+/H+ antiporter (TMEM165/GDT1 family)